MQRCRAKDSAAIGINTHKPAIIWQKLQRKIFWHCEIELVAII